MQHPSKLTLAVLLCTPALAAQGAGTTPGGFFQAGALRTIETGEFGSSVAIQGNYAVVGAPFHAGGRGRAFVFERAATGWADAQRVAVLDPSSPAPGQRFGHSVAIDGNTIAVGAYRATVGGTTEAGAVHVFEMPAGGWASTTEDAVLTASSTTPRSWLGWSVAVSGNAVVAGAYGATIAGQSGQGAAYVYTRPTSGWTDKTENAVLVSSDGASFDAFGISVAIQYRTIAVGASGANVGSQSNQGALYVFERPLGQSWMAATQVAKMTASDGQQRDALHQVALDRDTLVGGAPGAKVGGVPSSGAVYVFSKLGASWSNWFERAKLTSTDKNTKLLGDSVALRDGTIAAGSPDSAVGGNFQQGTVHVFSKRAFGWANAREDFILRSSDGAAGHKLGDAVAVDQEVLAGAPQGVQAYVFEPVFAAPLLSDVSPDAMTSHPTGPRTVTVTGTGLHTVTSLAVGGRALPIDGVTPTSLTFTLPTPFEIGAHQITLGNPAGIGNPLIIRVDGAHPPILLTPPTHLAGDTESYAVETGRQFAAAFFTSVSNRPSVLPQVVSFDIGNGFSELVYVGAALSDAAGQASLPITNPGGIFGVLYWQVLAFDSTGAGGLEVSNFTNVFYP